MTENKTKVSEELSKAGETSLITPLLLKLDKLRIVSTSAIEDEDFLFNINGKPCLPRKDLTVITGQPKTGKTMLISILMACCARDREQGGLVGIERIREEPLKVMWVDTEQNPQSTHYILRKRVMQLIGGEFPEIPFPRAVRVLGMADDVVLIKGVELQEQGCNHRGLSCLGELL